MRSAWTLIIAAATIAVFSNAAIAQQMLKHEPPNGGMRNGEVVYVDNGKCPKGQVQKVTGSYYSGRNQAGGGGAPRQRECVPTP